MGFALCLIFLLSAFGFPMKPQDENNLEALIAVCDIGDGSQVVCSVVNNNVTSYPLPSGLSAECRYNTSTANCYPHVERNMSDVIAQLTADALIVNASFIQGGVESASVVVYSEPYIPFVEYLQLNDSLFGASPELMLYVMGVSSLLTPDFNVSSINPSEIAAEDLAAIAAILNSSNITAGAGFSPDFSYLKTFQTFTWNITLPYNLSASLAGIVACNGTVVNNSCTNSSLGNGSWTSLGTCNTCGNCSTDTYALNCPQAGWFTVYGADPMPVYGGDNDAARVGNVTISKENITEGENVNASLQIYSETNQTFTAVILANTVNRWNSTLNMQEAPGWSTFDFTVQTSELSSGEYTLNVTVYNSTGSYVDWNSPGILTVSSASSGGFTVNKNVLNEGSIVLNDTVRYWINLSNAGSTGLFNVSLLDTYDVDLNYSGASVPPAAVNYSTRTVTWVNIINLTAEESYALYVNFTAIISAQTVSNVVNASAVNASGSVSTAYDSENIAINSVDEFTINLVTGWNLISLPLDVF